jgi:molecular chaperone DnaK
MGRVVGIDLGTTNSVVSVMEGGKPVVIANAEGMRTTPSVVGFSKDRERLVGQLARRQAVLDPQNTFYAIKRFIGSRYDELTPESKQVPYTIRRGDRDNIKMKCPTMDRDFAPEELSAMILRKLADEASRYLGEPVTGAVITVPAYFNDSQRQATRDSGRIAGLEVKRILNEPTAAALAYGLDRRENQTVLVFDLGGGTFDVSILDVSNGVFEVLATSGDTQLGGGDFDQKIVDWLATEFQKVEEVDLKRDRQSLQRLIEAAEKAKIELSGVGITDINLPFITATEAGPKHIETRLSRSMFEELCVDLLSRLREPVKQAVRDAGLGPMDIDEVVLVGGGTRMPMVQDLVRSMLRVEPNQNVNPDEVVAIGAAVQAGILGGELKDILLLDVTPVSIGLETIGGLMKKLIPRNTTIPVRRTDVFSTSEDSQTSVEINVVQGERELANGNRSLGRFKLMGIPPAPRGIPQVQVSFDIDANGILQVTAMDRTTGREQSITIQGASTLSEEEVQQMVRSAQEFAETDRLRKEKIDKRNRSETLIVQAERQLREATLDFGMQFVSPYRSRIEPLIKQLRSALGGENERNIDITQADLQDAFSDLQREIYDRNQEEKEEGGFFKAVKDFFLDEDDDYYDNGYGGYGAGGGVPRLPYGGGGSGGGYSGGSVYNDYNRGSFDYGRGSAGNLPGAGGSSYGRDSYGQGGGQSGNQSGGYNDRSNYNDRDNYNRNNNDRDNYNRNNPNDNRRDNYNPDDRYNNPNDRQDNYGRDSGNRDAGSRDAYRDAGGRDSGNRNDYDRDAGNRDSGNRDAGNRSSQPPRDPYSDRGGYNEPPPRNNTRRQPDRPDYSRDNWDDEDNW